MAETAGQMVDSLYALRLRAETRSFQAVPSPDLMACLLMRPPAGTSVLPFEEIVRTVFRPSRLHAHRVEMRRNLPKALGRDAQKLLRNASKALEALAESSFEVPELSADWVRAVSGEAAPTSADSDGGEGRRGHVYARHVDVGGYWGREINKKTAKRKDDRSQTPEGSNKKSRAGDGGARPVRAAAKQTPGSAGSYKTAPPAETSSCFRNGKDCVLSILYGLWLWEEDIAAWARRPGADFNFCVDFEMPRNVGSTIQAEHQPQGSKYVRMLLARDENKRFFVLTAFPFRSAEQDGSRFFGWANYESGRRMVRWSSLENELKVERVVFGQGEGVLFDLPHGSAEVAKRSQETLDRKVLDRCEDWFKKSNFDESVLPQGYQQIADHFKLSETAVTRWDWVYRRLGLPATASITPEALLLRAGREGKDAVFKRLIEMGVDPARVAPSESLSAIEWATNFGSANFKKMVTLFDAARR